MLGQVPRPGSSTLLVRQGHAYQARWIAPVPCAVLGSAGSVSALVAAMLQQLGPQFGRQQPWSTVRADTQPLSGWSPPAGHAGAAGMSGAFNECTVFTEATWTAPDTAIDPSLASLPGLGLLPLVDLWDARTGELLFDRNAVAQPSAPAPGPAPAPPTSGQPPAAPAVSKGSMSGALVVGVLVLAVVAAVAVARA